MKTAAEFPPQFFYICLFVFFVVFALFQYEDGDLRGDAQPGGEAVPEAGAVGDEDGGAVVVVVEARDRAAVEALNDFVQSPDHAAVGVAGDGEGDVFLFR